MQPLSLSVVIPTFHRYPSLEKTLACIKGPWEVIVVDQTRPPAFNPGAWPGLTLRYLTLDRPNLPAARNAGLAAAGGDLILFLDDDVTFGPELFSRHAEAHAAHPEAGAVTGGIALVPPEKWPDQPFVAAIDPDTAKFQVNFGLSREGFVEYHSGGNVSFKRSAVEKTGLFDPRYLGNALYEEIDYSIRLRAAGFKIFFEPKACVTHHRAPLGGTRANGKARYYFIKFYNSGYFYFKHLDPLNPGKFLKAMKDEIEFYTRGEKGRDFISVGLFFLGLLLGTLRGLLNRPPAKASG